MSFLIDHYPAEITLMVRVKFYQVVHSREVLRIENEDLLTSIDSHFHDVRVGNEWRTYFSCDRPRLSLVKYLPRKEKIGFCLKMGQGYAI